MSLAESKHFELQGEDVYAKIAIFTSHVEKAVQLASSIVVSDKASASNAINVVAESRSLKRKIDSTRKEIGEPAKKFLSRLKAIADGFIDKLDQIDSSISSKVSAWKQLENQAEMNPVQASIYSEEFGVTLNPYMPEDTSKINFGSRTNNNTPKVIIVIFV